MSIRFDQLVCCIHNCQFVGWFQIRYWQQINWQKVPNRCKCHVGLPIQNLYSIYLRNFYRNLPFQHFDLQFILFWFRLFFSTCLYKFTWCLHKQKYHFSQLFVHSKLWKSRSNLSRWCRKEVQKKVFLLACTTFLHRQKHWKWMFWTRKQLYKSLVWFFCWRILWTK